MNGVWIRVGRGTSSDPNLSLSALPTVKHELESIGVELWGWHVPFCADLHAASAEAQHVLQWLDQAKLNGIVVDAERTNENPRFQGGSAEANTYMQALTAGLIQRGCGIAFSSHDQPSLHMDLPFDAFLKHAEDICPQVYYRSADASPRLNKSIHDYKALVAASEFALRYKPTGNITMKDDIPFPDVATCLAATKSFLNLVALGGYSSHSFWCWDTAPVEIWKLFNEMPA